MDNLLRDGVERIIMDYSERIDTVLNRNGATPFSLALTL